MRLVLAGASSERVCGTRDYAHTLEEPLRRAGADVQTIWWERGSRPLSTWTAELRDADADATLWQYSPFTYASRGLPTLVAPVLRALGNPLVTVLHELAFPWRVNGARGAVHAAAQRLALHPIVRASAGVVVTTESRRAWLTTRDWLPRRPVEFLPVVSNVAPVEPRTRDGDELRVGVFGFRRAQEPVDLIVESVARVRGARLVLVGAPGPDAPEAAAWRRAAAAAGRRDLVSFTGVLEPEALSVELAGLDVMLFTDPVGPTPRRGTLAAALAHGKPIVAFGGPQTWDRYVHEEALVVTAPTADSLAAELGRLAASVRARAEQSDRARAFHDTHLAGDVVARRLLSFVAEVAS
jgi:glycosyltransferase involved in cell wall biosynthesis